MGTSSKHIIVTPPRYAIFLSIPVLVATAIGLVVINFNVVELAVWHMYAVMIGVVAILLVTFFRIQLVRQRRKNAEVSQWAAERGWTYTEVARNESWRSREPFDQGKDEHVLNRISGVHRGYRVTAFSYRFTTGKDPHRYQVATVRTPGRTPLLQLQRETFGRKLQGHFGAHDPQLDNQEFNDRFYIQTTDDDFAWKVLTPAVMEWLLQEPRALAAPVRFLEGELLTWQSGWMSADDSLAAADFLIDFLERLPDGVFEGYRQA